MKTNIAFWLLSGALVLALPGCKKNPPAPQEVKVTSVTVTPSTLSLVEGESGDLTVSVLPSDATNPTVTWSSSDPSVVSVSSGTVTAVSPGVATVTATTGGKQGSCTVTVSAAAVPVTGVEMSLDQAWIYVGETLSLTATVLPGNADDKTVSWSSASPEVASVDQEGLVTAAAPGNTVITVTTRDGGKTASCTVDVLPKGELVYEKMDAVKLADMNNARASFAIFRSGDGVVVAGGHVNSFIASNSAEYYDPAANTWTKLGDMSSHHDNTAFAALGDGRYMVLGGSGDSGSGLHKAVDIYLPSTQTFISGPGMKSGRALFRALALGNGDVLVSGNWYSEDSIEAYSAETGEFSFVKDVSQARSFPYLLRTSADNAIIFGNYGSQGGSFSKISIDRYKGDAYTTPLFDEWRPVGNDAGWSADLLFIGDAAAGDFRYLLPVFQGSSTNEATAFGIALVKGEEFSLLETDFEIPLRNGQDEKILYSALVADSSRKVAYLFGSNILRGSMAGVTCYILRMDYSGIAAGGDLKLKMYYTDPLDSFNCGGQGGFILLPDGRLMVCGGIYDSNYRPFPTAYAFKPF